jgi:hypothetical protein
MPTTPPSINPVDFTGVLTITTRRGSVTMQGSGNVDMQAGTFIDTGTILGGTGRFRGVSGRFTSQGSFNVQTNSLNGTITGIIFGAHHRHHRQHP